MSFTVGVHAGLSVDHLVLVPRGARFDELGGPGLYAALGARLVDGASVRLHANVPKDDARFEALFSKLEIDSATCVHVDSVPRVWILNAPEGRRIVSTANPGDMELEAPAPAVKAEPPIDAPATFYSGLDGLLESSPERRPDISGGASVGIDPHQSHMVSGGLDYLRRVSPEGAVILPSRVQLSLMEDDPRAAARTIAARLGTPVVARLDAEGMYVVSCDGRWILRDENVTVNETTGAGDASAAAIVAALAGGADLLTAAMFGMSVARLAVADWGHAALSVAESLASPFNAITATKELHR